MSDSNILLHSIVIGMLGGLWVICGIILYGLIKLYRFVYERREENDHPQP